MKNSRTFSCSCGDAVKMEYKEFKEHLKIIHSLDTSQAKGLKTMVMHVDGTNWFSSNYQWTLDCGLKFVEYVTRLRDKKIKIY